MISFEIKKDVLALRERWRKRPDYNCFWSGPDNDRGLRLTPTIDAGRVSVDVKIETFHTGFPGIANGGVSFTIIDGLMSWYLMSHLGRSGFTKSSTIEYYLPLHLGKTYRFTVKQEGGNEIQSLDDFKLIGQAYEVKNANEVSSKARLVMRAGFFIPDRETAKKVLQVELGPEGEELFPQERGSL